MIRKCFHVSDAAVPTNGDWAQTDDNNNNHWMKNKYIIIYRNKNQQNFSDSKVLHTNIYSVSRQQFVQIISYFNRHLYLVLSIGQILN